MSCYKNTVAELVAIAERYQRNEYAAWLRSLNYEPAVSCSGDDNEESFSIPDRLLLSTFEQPLELYGDTIYICRHCDTAEID